MIRIAICDDETAIANEVEKLILKFGNENNIEFQIKKYLSGEALIKSDLSFDAVFLDIIMNKIDGIETGKIIKNNNIKTHIIYITNFTNYSMNAHKVHAFDFIEKPIDYLKISAVLCDLVKYVYNDKGKTEAIRITVDGGAELIINTGDILFFEYKEPRKLIMYTSDNSDKGVIIRDTIYELYERLNKSNFFMPHKAFIINFKFVRSAETKQGEITMTNGKLVNLSQKRRKEFNENLHKYMRTKGAII